jgi:hypothetical protein
VVIDTDCIGSCNSTWQAITAKTNEQCQHIWHTTFLGDILGWVTTDILNKWLSTRCIPSHCWNWLIFCNYILLNLKFSGECFVDLFFSTFSFVLCVVCHSVNYVIWLPFCPLFCLSFCELRHMITLCVVCHSVNYVIWLHFVLSVILWITSYDYPLCCLSFCELRHMITLLSFVLSVILWSTSYDYPFGIFILFL